MKFSEFDAIIIGGGPAGAASARLLASWGRDVLVIARTPSRRTLAESLPPSCTKLFDRIGVRNEIDCAGYIRATGNTVRWGGGAKRIERFDASSTGYQIARDTFDAVLMSTAIAAGARVAADSSVRDVARRDGMTRVSYESADGRYEAIGRFVLDCSGRSGVIARRGLRRPVSAARTTAVIGVWDSPDGWQIDEPTHTFVESFDGGWAWSVPVSATRRYVTVMLDPTTTDLPGRDELLHAYRAELARAPMIAELTRDAVMAGDPWGCDASPYTSSRGSDDGLLLVGDAASFVDPLSSFGVKKALASAWLASVVANSMLSDSAIASAATALFDAREAEMYAHLQQQSAALSRDAAGTHETEFWLSRADAEIDVASRDLDANALRGDQRVLDAFEDLKRRDRVSLRMRDEVRVVDGAVVRGNRVVLDRHLVAPLIPQGARYCRNVDLYMLAQLAPAHDQVPDLFDAYNRAAPPAPLPDFLGALSTLIGLQVLSFA